MTIPRCPRCRFGQLVHRRLNAPSEYTCGHLDHTADLTIDAPRRPVVLRWPSGTPVRIGPAEQRRLLTFGHSRPPGRVRLPGWHLIWVSPDGTRRLELLQTNRGDHTQ